MLRKKRIGGRRRQVKVTFVLDDTPAGVVHVVGDFNEWRASTPMQREEDGAWSLTLTLDGGREYQFRYLIDNERWINDPGADKYVPNQYGGENAVIVT